MMREASDFGLKKGIKRAENMLPHPDGRTELGLMRARPEMEGAALLHRVRCDPKASDRCRYPKSDNGANITSPFYEEGETTRDEGSVARS